MLRKARPKLNFFSITRNKYFLISGITSLALIGIGVIVAVTFSLSQPKYTSEPFPIGVDPEQKLILDSAKVDQYLLEHLNGHAEQPIQTSWIERATSKIAREDWYQNLASPVSRILVVLPGERKEEIAASFGKILGWKKAEQEEFLALVSSSSPTIPDGKFFPDNYVIEKNATPEAAALMLIERFESQVQSRYSTDIEEIVPLDQALIIASILEREAYDFEDMRHISGIIWNRLFIDMNLQLDTTLQYAKGSQPTGPWWPRVVPKDKYIKSSFNTYKNPGLPPSPISNPSLEAILAALNPLETDCLFFFHDARAGFHCAETYKEHVALLKQYYGRGR